MSTSLQKQIRIQRQHLLTQQSDTNNSFYNDSVNKDVEESTNFSKKTVIRNNEQGSVFFDFTEVFVWGDDSFGQLGLYHQKIKKGNQDQKSFKVPKTCSFNILIKQVSCGQSHSAILTNQGHLYMMGSNTDGQLGIGENCPEFHITKCAGAPCLVDSLREMKVDKVSCGKNFTFALVENGQEQSPMVYAWGSNKYGQLGIDMGNNIGLPVKLNCFEGIVIKYISCGNNHTLFIQDAGQVFGCGQNNCGQLAIDNTQVNLPTLIESGLQDLNIVQVSAGQNYSLFLNDRGEVFACGSNQRHQLGVPEVQNFCNQPIFVSNLAKHQIIKIQANQHSAAITSNGELFLWGTGVFGLYKTPQKILTISNQVKDVSLGESLGAAVDQKGLLWTWGTNNSGELGVGDTDPRIHPYPVLTLKGKTVSQIACGSSFVIALGSNLKKEIPGLKLKQKSSKVTRLPTSGDNGRRGSLSKSKKKNSSTSNLFRKDSTGSLGKIYSGNASHNITACGNSNGQQSPRIKLNKLTSLMNQKRHSKSSVNKSKKSTVENSKIPKSKSKTRKIVHVQNSCEESQLNLNMSGLLLNNKSDLTQQIQSPMNIDPKKSLKQSQVLSNIETSSNIDQANTNESSSHNTTQVMMHIQSQNNKEKMIKDLTNENKAVKIQLELLKKENKKMKTMNETLEKQAEKNKLNNTHHQELQNAYNEIKRKEQKLNQSKQKKKELRNLIQQLQHQIEQYTQERQKIISENQELQNQIQILGDNYQQISEKLQISEKKNAEQEQEMKEFQDDVQMLRDHSKEVEQGLLKQLNDVSERYKETLKEKDEVNSLTKIQKKKLDDIQSQLKDSQYYASALERENHFLREEIEKAKYSKDKEEYSRFISGLTQIKKKQTNNTTTVHENDLQQKSYNNIKSPLQERNLNESNTSSYSKKYDENTVFSKQEQKTECDNNQLQESVNWNDLKMSYNQKLLKSIEKKTLKENSISQSYKFK